MQQGHRRRRNAEELKNLSTDPLAHNSAGEDLVQAVDILNPAGGSMVWSPFGDGVVGERFRGSIEFDLNVPESGMNWIVAIQGKILGQKAPIDTMALKISIGGVDLGSQTLRASMGEPATLRVLTPRLSVGKHRLRLFVDNLIARKSFQLLAVELRRPTGADLDADGLPDWLASFQQANTWGTPSHVSTPVSPLFIEGGSRYAGNIAVMAGGLPTSVQRGACDTHWYANIPLGSGGTTAITGTFEAGDTIHSTQASWTSFQVGSQPTLHLRQGDTLKFSFSESPGHSGSVNYTMLPATWDASGPAFKAQSYQFSYPGTFTLYGYQHSTGLSATTTIVVHTASVAEPLILGSERPRIFDLTGVPFELKLDTLDPLRFSKEILLAGSGGKRVRMECPTEGNYGLLARLPSGGPIVANLPVQVMAYAGATTGEYQLIGPSDIDGYIVISVPLVLAGLPEGYTVRVEIFRAGVMFENGTSTLNLSAADFIDGQTMLRFLYPETMQGGYCHFVDVLDPDGNIVVHY